MKNTALIMAAAGAVLAFGRAMADDQEFETDEAETVEAEVGENSQPAPQPNIRTFYTLPFCSRLEGKAEVLQPGQTVWQPVVEGKYYPLGAAYRTVPDESVAKPRLAVSFGPEAEVSVVGAASFATRAQPIGGKDRAIVPMSGTVKVKLSATMPEGLFSVITPSFTVCNLAGISRYTYTETPDGDDVVVRCVSGTASIQGRHYFVKSMRAANEVRIRSTRDKLVTLMYGNSGDVPVQLDQGQRLVRDLDSSANTNKIVETKLDWKLSPRTAVRIYRSLPDIGERMSVTVMTFDASGELRNRCAFAENRPEINSGELGPISREEREKLAKRAADVVEVHEAEQPVSETAESGSAADGDSSDMVDGE